MQTEKVRLDDHLVSVGLATDIKRAEALLLAGSVLVNDAVQTKKDYKIKKNDVVRIRTKIREFVSRGAEKLQGALERWKDFPIEEVDFWDWGASTGGFSEILLLKKAKSVTCVDVGYGQLASRIANDKRVVVLDRTHFKDFSPKLTKETLKVGVVMDLSFISIVQAFERLTEIAQANPEIHLFGLSLLKPQFEVDPNQLDKGILRDTSKIGTLLRTIWKRIRKRDPLFHLVGVEESPIRGTLGNREFFLAWNRFNQSDQFVRRKWLP